MTNRKLNLTNSNDIICDSLALNQADGTLLDLAEALSGIDQAIVSGQSNLSTNYYTKTEVDGLDANLQSQIDDRYTIAETNQQITNAVTQLIDTAPEALNTLNELSQALNDDPNFATTVTNQLALKLNITDHQTTLNSTLNYINNADQQLQLQVDNLSNTKLNIADYQVTETSILNYVNTQDGNLQTYVDNLGTTKLNISDFQVTEQSILNYVDNADQQLQTQINNLSTQTGNNLDTKLNIADYQITETSILNYVNAEDSKRIEVIIPPRTDIPVTDLNQTIWTYNSTRVGTGPPTINQDGSVTQVPVTAWGLRFSSFSNITDFNSEWRIIYKFQTGTAGPANYLRLRINQRDWAEYTDNTLEDGWVQGESDSCFSVRIGRIDTFVGSYTLTNTSGLPSNFYDGITPRYFMLSRNASGILIFQFFNQAQNLVYTTRTQQVVTFDTLNRDSPICFFTNDIGDVVWQKTIAGDGNTLTTQDLENAVGGGANFENMRTVDSTILEADRVLTLNSNAQIITSNVNNNEVNQLVGVTSNVQTQLNDLVANKEDRFMPLAAANRVAVSDATGFINVSTINLNELGTLDGIRFQQGSTIQDQLDGKLDDPTFERNVVPVTNQQRRLISSTVSTDELENLIGSTSNIQTQIDSKENIITGAVSNVLQGNLTPSSAVVTLPSGKLATVNVSDIEVSRLDGVTGNIQTQLNNKVDVVTLNNYDTSITVSSKISNLVDSAPETLNTLNELAAALGDDPNFATTVSNEIGLKANTADTYTRTFIDGLLDGKANTPNTLVSNRVLTVGSGGNIATSNRTQEELNTLANISGNIQTQLNAKQNSQTTFPNKALATDNAGNITEATTTTQELDRLSGVTSNVQTQLNSKQATIASANKLVNLPAMQNEKVVITNANGELHTFGHQVSITQLNSLNSITGNVQDQLNAKQATLTGATSNLTGSNLKANRVCISDGNGKIIASTNITTTELNRLNNVSSNVQTQLNNKQATITGAASTIVTNNLEVDRVLISSSNDGKVVTSLITPTELLALSGISGNIQTQIDNISVGGFTANRALISNASGDIVVAPNVTSGELNQLRDIRTDISVQAQIDANIANILSNQISIGQNTTDINAIKTSEFVLSYSNASNRITINNPGGTGAASHYSTIRLNSEGVQGALFAGGSAFQTDFTLATDSLHPIKIHADRVNNATLVGITVETNNNVTFGGTTTENSDRKLKDNIKDVDLKACQEFVKNVSCKTFTRNDMKDNKPRLGYIAQDLEANIPKEFSNIVSSNTDENGETTLSVAYARVVCILHKVIQDQQNQIEDLLIRVKNLESK